MRSCDGFQKQSLQLNQISLFKRYFTLFSYIVSLGIVVGLSSCTSLPWYSGHVIGQTELFGVTVRYMFPEDDLNYVSNRDGTRYVGMVVYEPVERGCNVLLRKSYFDRAEQSRLRTVVAHEIAHCLDRYVLEHRHNGFADEGCHYGAYWCKPNEGFANFYAHYFIDLCGSLAPLGWPLEDAPATCDTLPHPSLATPEQMRSALNAL